MEYDFKYAFTGGRWEISVLYWDNGIFRCDSHRFEKLNKTAIYFFIIMPLCSRRTFKYTKQILCFAYFFYIFVYIFISTCVLCTPCTMFINTKQNIMLLFSIRTNNSRDKIVYLPVNKRKPLLIVSNNVCFFYYY